MTYRDLYMQQPVVEPAKPLTEEDLKRQTRATWFDANEHRMIDRVTGLPRGRKPGHSAPKSGVISGDTQATTTDTEPQKAR